MPRTGEPGRSVGSRLLDVLFAFEPGASELSLAELSRRSGLPHATTRRLVLDLLGAGALERRPDGRFTVGLRLWQLGTLAPVAGSLRAAAMPFMEDLYSALRQHVQLAVLEGDEAVLIERLSAPRALGLVSAVGGSLPLYCSGVGKVLLSHAGPELAARVLGGRLARFTPHTIVDPELLRRELADCRRLGIASVRGEFTEGADSVATRIMDREGRVVAALSVVVRSGTVRRQAIVPSVVASGLGISRMLGWRSGTRIRRGGGELLAG